jgi:lipopolysaccharide biosynthesis protein
MKIIAFYLPQFHTIPENDKWWGKGFTEWTNTKKAKPLFKGHYQPREPMNEYYYDLSDINTMIWQSKLAKKYGIYGFCYYHYWFKGKKLLEKPLENMLSDKRVDIPFCLSWANEPWTRAWDGGDKEILMPQDYGGKKDWENHFYYLLEYFKDRRYILINNKPVFLIYRTSNIPKVNEMVEFWDKLAKSEGFDGLYIVETLNTFQKKTYVQTSQAIVEFEPMFTLSNDYPIYLKIYDFIYTKLFTNGVLSKQYDKVWNIIINRKSDKYGVKKVFKGAFVDWDNTPRKGKRGLVFIDASPDKFKKYISLQIKNAKQLNSDFLFINAWNEWAEGTYLEPDKVNGFKYLEALKSALKENKVFK